MPNSPASRKISPGRNPGLASPLAACKPKLRKWLPVLSWRPGAAASERNRSAAPTSPLRVTERGDGITIACRCGCFFFSFRSIAVARRGRFRCLICDTERPIADLIHADGRPRARGPGTAGHDVPG